MKKNTLFSILTFLLMVSPIYGGVSLTLQEVLNLGLPVISINTVDQVMPTADRIDPPSGCWGASVTNKTTAYGRLVYLNTAGDTLYDSDEYKEKESGMTLKVRGNTTALSVKRPYKIKLQKKADLFFRGDKKYKEKNWALLKEGVSSPIYGMFNSLVGNAVSKYIGMEWVPNMQYVNLVINGNYRGYYTLIESVERNTDSRINVEKDGFIGELDAYWWNEDFSIETSIYDLKSCPLKITFKYPETEDFSEESTEQIHDIFVKMEESQLSGNYPDSLDVESWARWLLGQEILGQHDFAGSNIFLVKQSISDNSLIRMPCLWDFDSMCQVDNAWADIHNWHYFIRLFNSPNKEFGRTFKMIYQQESEKIFNQLDSLLESLKTDPSTACIQSSIETDKQLYPWLAYSNTVDALTNMQTYFKSRKAWMDEHINDIETVDEGGLLPTSATNVIAEYVGQDDKNADIFNIIGQRCNKNNTGLYIMHRNGRTVKILAQ